MTSQQMWFLMPITSLVLLLLCIIPSLTEVVKSMSDCNHFLLDQTPPHVPSVLENGKILNQNRYKPICQTYRNTRRFVTLYDVSNKIPVFSAFKYVGEKERKRPKKHWKVEPQLEDENADQNMMGRDGQTTYNHQAINTDFRSNKTFDRGHLFPSAYAFTKVDKMSTFTLTNVVPQAGTFNRGSWNKMENCIKCVMEKYCINSSGVNEGFVVTGAQPSSNSSLNNRINVPSLLWSAFCCYSANMETWIASAHWGDNVPDESEDKHLQTKTLAELHSKLRASNSEFRVFPGAQCPLHTTVTTFYPEMKNCQCPPSISTIPAPPILTSGPHVLISAPPPLIPGTNSTPAPPPLIPGTNSTSAPPPLIPGTNSTSAPPPLIPGTNSTSAPPPLIPCTNSTPAPPPLIPGTNSTSAPPPLIPCTNSTPAPPPLIPGTNSTSAPPPLIPGTNSTSAPPPLIPCTNSTPAPPPLIPGTNSTSAPPPLIPGTNSTSAPPLLIPGTNSTSAPPPLIPGTNSTSAPPPLIPGTNSTSASFKVEHGPNVSNSAPPTLPFGTN